MLDSLGDDLLDLLIGNRGLRGDGVDGATALDSLEERSRARHCGAGLSRRGCGTRVREELRERWKMVSGEQDRRTGEFI